MAGESVSNRKLTFLIFFLTYCGRGHMYPSNAQVPNLDQIFQEIWNNLNILNFPITTNDNSLADSIHPKYDIVTCAKELNSIKESLHKFELWPIKLLDSWGRIPPGILSGNLYDFGDFRRCFHLDRNGKTYPTQYCWGQITVNFSLFLTPDYSQKNGELQSLVPLSKNIKRVNEMISVFNPQTFEGLNIGICLPDICSPIFFARQVNSLIMEMNISNIQIEVPEERCQFEEKITEIDTFDVVAIVLLMIVICLMILSSCYDLWCAFNKLPKSQMLTAFSVYTNSMKILSYKADKTMDRIPCLDGIRSISTLCIVLFHTYRFVLIFPIMNAVDVDPFFDAFPNMIVINGARAVDTFLLLSGLLISIKLFRKMEKTQCCMNIPMLYINRYLRLTPLLGVTILLSTTLLRFLGNGPIWPNLMQSVQGQCMRNWWTSLLYVQNYVNSDDICLLHTWYLAVDMQLYILAPFIVQLIYLLKLRVIFALILPILACITWTFTTYIKRHLTVTSDVHERFLSTYLPTHARFMPWMIGIFLGYILHKMRDKTIRIPTFYNSLGWIISISTLMSVILANHSKVQIQKLTTPSNGLYESLSYVAWPIAISYIIFACVHNNGGMVNWFLSHPFWQPISNLSYAIYLIHELILFMFQGAMKTVQYFSGSMLFHTFLANCMVSIIVSVFFVLAFEAPLSVVQNVIFGDKPQKSKDSDFTSEASQKK